MLIMFSLKTNSHVSFRSFHVSESLALAENVNLILQQLPHKGQVGGDDVAPLLHKVESLIQTETLRMHEVGQADGGRP